MPRRTPSAGCVGGVFADCGDEGPTWGMSLRSAGSMRFRWKEENPVRDAFMRSLAGNDHEIASIELIHSQTVYAISTASELQGKQGDGIITQNRRIVPVVTAADCMPIFLYEPNASVFGVLHSGWRGTGIVCRAIELAERMYGARRESFFVVMGPHIHQCCYTIDEARARFFSGISPDCVCRRADDGRLFLSLAAANHTLLTRLGVPQEHIVVHPDCTACNEAYGSFRRETAHLPPSMPLEERQRHVTVQAAFVKW